MNEIKDKLVALEAKMDATLFAVMKGPDGRYYNEDGTEADSGGFRLRGSGIPTVAAAGIGAYAADRAIMKNYGGGGSGMAVRGSAYRSAGRDLMESSRALGGRALDAGNDGLRAGQRSWRATKPGAIGNKAGNTGLFGRLRKALGAGARIATGGRVRFEQVKNRIIELAEGRYQGGTAAIFGNEIAAALNAKKGKKLDAFGEAYGHRLGEGLKGGALGTAAGAAAGVGAGAIAARGMMSRAMRGPGRNIARKAILSSVGRYAGPAALLGLAGGLGVGNIKGNFDKKAREIRNKYVA